MPQNFLISTGPGPSLLGSDLGRGQNPEIQHYIFVLLKLWFYLWFYDKFST